LTYGSIKLFSGLAKSSLVMSKHAWSADVRQSGSAHWLVVLKMVVPCGLRLLVRGWYRCTSLVMSSVRLIRGFRAWCWWCSQSYRSREMRVGKATNPYGRGIPILWVSVLFHDVLGGTNVVYAEVCGWKSLFGSFSVSNMVQDRDNWRLGSLGGEVC